MLSSVHVHIHVISPVNPKSNPSQSTGTIPKEPEKLSIQPIQEHIIQAVSGENMHVTDTPFWSESLSTPLVTYTFAPIYS